jgi:pyruvate/2-oxoglutarate dehydrogenase complex dihydrolipoamide dehydrogenase (E3) component
MNREGAASRGGVAPAPLLVDAAIIGTGQAAVPLSVALAARGETVAVFEGGLLGGSCVNVGCTPTKTLRKSARVAHLARRAHEFGVQVGEVRVDVAAAMDRAAAVVEASRAGLTRWLDGASGVTLVREWGMLDGRVRDRFVVRGGATTVHASRVYLNTGTRPFLPPIEGLADVPVLTNENVLSLRSAPGHLVILGGSYIGLELGQIFRRMGSAVSIIETGDTIAAREDDDISLRLSAMLRDEGVALYTQSSVLRVSADRDAGSPGALVIDVQRASAHAIEAVRASHLLVATGRIPNTDQLGLETVGVPVDARGFIPVNGRLETSVPGIWALGDINKRGAFTHTSYQDHEIVLANHLGGSRTADDRISTYALFTDPPLGRVGLTERDARALMPHGRRFLIASHEMKSVSRAKEEGETIGVIRLLVDADTERFVGASLLGIGADEIVQTIGAMMAADAPYRVLRDALPVHPTVTEFFPTILGKLQPLV